MRNFEFDRQHRQHRQHRQSWVFLLTMLTVLTIDLRYFMQITRVPVLPCRSNVMSAPRFRSKGCTRRNSLVSLLGWRGRLYGSSANNWLCARSVCKSSVAVPLHGPRSAIRLKIDSAIGLPSIAASSTDCLFAA